jgi:hypothetical protein
VSPQEISPSSVSVSVTSRPALFSAATLQAIFWTGLLAGALDITAAMTMTKILSGGDPTRILQNIASGVFKNRAFSGGWSMKAAGLFFHFVVAYSFTFFFFAIQPRVRFFARRPIVGAFLYCAFVWCVMNLIVVPITFSRAFRLDPIPNIRGYLVLVVAFALPISFLARRHYAKGQTL